MQEKILLKNLLAVNTDALLATLKGMDDNNSHNRPGDICNSAHFVLGHIVISRYEIAAFLGIKDKHPWGKSFSYGAALEDKSKYPPLCELKELLDFITKKINDRLEEITDIELEAEGPFEVEPLPKTIGGILYFYIFHDAYHIGQIGYLRRYNGLEAAFG